jgi:DNA-binding NtrC family response regulator
MHLAPRTAYTPFAVSTRTTPDLSLTFPGKSAPLRRMLELIDKFAAHDHLPILVEGESGTGKSFVARRLHELSPRGRESFQQVLLSALDDNLAASELFGHVRGAFTGAQGSRPGRFVAANRGTLFLDEIGKASAAVQRMLLHAVEHNEVCALGTDRPVRLDVRIVVATNVPLERLVAEGSFLPDLAARLTTFRVRVPTLRERREDLELLVRGLVQARAPRYGYASGPPSVAPGLMQLFEKAEWPNNVRQLDGVVQRILVEAGGAPVLECHHLPDDVALSAGRAPKAARPLQITPEVVRELQREGKTITEIARQLGVARCTIYRHMARTADAV